MNCGSRSPKSVRNSIRSWGGLSARSSRNGAERVVHLRAGAPLHRHPEQVRLDELDERARAVRDREPDARRERPPRALGDVDGEVLRLLRDVRIAEPEPHRAEHAQAQERRLAARGGVGVVRVPGAERERAADELLARAAVPGDDDLADPDARPLVDPEPDVRAGAVGRDPLLGRDARVEVAAAGVEPEDRRARLLDRCVRERPARGEAGLAREVGRVDAARCPRTPPPRRGCAAPRGAGSRGRRRRGARRARGACRRAPPRGIRRRGTRRRGVRPPRPTPPDPTRRPADAAARPRAASAIRARARRAPRRRPPRPRRRPRAPRRVARGAPAGRGAALP